VTNRALRHMSNGLRKPQCPKWPDRLSNWELPPPSARAVGEIEPVRCFESAEAALAFLVTAASVPRRAEEKPVVV
jgi:hypothetical protein